MFKLPSWSRSQMQQKMNPVEDDLSDYLWYMTNVNLDTQDPIFGQNMTLRVNTTGQVLHAFVNGKHVGSQWDQTGGAHFMFEQKVNFKAGENLIVLLSATVGLQNYGSFFDDQPHKPWYTESLPINRMFTWYKASFKAPLGLEPVVVDLQGLGKGHAYVNGQSIGNRTISEIRFASFGDVQGTSGAFKKGTCEASNALSIIEKACVRQESCVIGASKANLGSSNCGSGFSKKLVMEAIC
ncbi:hypothetical protein NE237_003282 [Protea cynaroides]|uniref:SUEL-type lectin domain-containing protein n=1 Tax=Protea cynaroides TaxID=273540 RepID=A0A9Q0QSF4_9MAGN|nr:hypothetical protein NE237_003282 [Protea cynaroides]